MAAGLSKAAIDGRVRRRLERIARENGGLAARGEAFGTTAEGLTWRARICISRASNGEVFGAPVYSVTDGETVESFAQLGDTVPDVLRTFKARRATGTLFALIEARDAGPNGYTVDPLAVGEFAKVRRLQWQAYGNRPSLWEVQPSGLGYVLLRELSFASREANPDKQP